VLFAFNSVIIIIWLRANKLCFNFQCSWQSTAAGPASSPCVSLVWLLSHWSADHYGKQLPQPTMRYISNDLFTDLHSSLVALSLLLCFELLIIFDFNYRDHDSLTQLYQHLSFSFVNYLAPVLSSGGLSQQAILVVYTFRYDFTNIYLNPYFECMISNEL